MRRTQRKIMLARDSGGQRAVWAIVYRMTGALCATPAGIAFWLALSSGFAMALFWKIE